MSSDDLENSALLKLKAMCHRLQKENLYFRTLLNISPEQEILPLNNENLTLKSAEISQTLSSKAVLPQTIELVLANLIYISIKNLPSKLINQIKKIAAFQNPEFYRAQAMRLSTYGKPGIIYCAEEFKDYIGLPRGCEDELLVLLKHYKIKAEICDKTQIGKSIDTYFMGELKPEQQKALDVLLSHRCGILSAATAFGKTVLAARIIAERKTNTLILVHRQQLLDQWKERLSLFLGIPTKSIGALSNGRNKLTNHIDIAMLQSLSKKGNISEEVTRYGQVIADECHHISAFSFEQILKKVSARYVLGLTATPIRKDGHHPIIIMQCGPIRYRSHDKNKIDPIKYQVYIRQTTFNYSKIVPSLKITNLYTDLTNDEERNEQIFNDVLLALENKRKPVLLTERTQHLYLFLEKFSKFVKHIFVLRGGMKQKERQLVLKTLTELPANAERLIIATGQCIGEGFDDPQLDTLFLTLPISWHGKLQQYVGRLHRMHQNKNNIVVYDYLDSNVPILVKRYQKRLKKYKLMGYSIHEK